MKQSSAPIEAATTNTTTAELAAWTAALDRSAVPATVLEHTARLVLDGIGAGLFGATTPWGRIVGDLVVEQGGVEEAAVWGSGIRVPASQAPLANGTFMHSFEFDDLHAAAVIHGGAQVVPAALAVAGMRAAGRGPGLKGTPTAEELALACVAGFEVGGRIGLATGAAQLGRGFHPSPNTGLFTRPTVPVPIASTRRRPHQSLQQRLCGAPPASVSRTDNSLAGTMLLKASIRVRLNAPN